MPKKRRDIVVDSLRNLPPNAVSVKPVQNDNARRAMRAVPNGPKPAYTVTIEEDEPDRELPERSMPEPSKPPMLRPRLTPAQRRAMMPLLKRAPRSTFLPAFSLEPRLSRGDLQMQPPPPRPAAHPRNYRSLRALNSLLPAPQPSNRRTVAALRNNSLAARYAGGPSRPAGIGFGGGARGAAASAAGMGGGAAGGPK